MLLRDCLQDTFVSLPLFQYSFTQPLLLLFSIRESLMAGGDRSLYPFIGRCEHLSRFSELNLGSVCTVPGRDIYGKMRS